MTPNIASYIMAFIPFLSQLGDKLDPEQITRYGLLGCVLAWFMFRADRRLAGIEHKMGGLNRTMLIEILSRPTTSERAKIECRNELRKVAPNLADELDSK